MYCVKSRGVKFSAGGGTSRTSTETTLLSCDGIACLSWRSSVGPTFSKSFLPRQNCCDSAGWRTSSSVTQRGMNAKDPIESEAARDFSRRGMSQIAPTRPRSRIFHCSRPQASRLLGKLISRCRTSIRPDIIFGRDKGKQQVAARIDFCLEYRLDCGYEAGYFRQAIRMTRQPWPFW